MKKISEYVYLSVYVYSVTMVGANRDGAHAPAAPMMHCAIYVSLAARIQKKIHIQQYCNKTLMIRMMTFAINLIASDRYRPDAGL